jgi:hypothetical protein
MEQKVCLECGKPLMGRIDKKFCNTRCRNDYNNAHYGQTTNYIRKVNRILKRNRQILKQHVPQDKSIKVTKKTLLKEGLALNTLPIYILLNQKKHTTFAMSMGI